MQDQNNGQYIDGPDEKVVNSEEQNNEINAQDPEQEHTADDKAKGYGEGNRNDSDTEESNVSTKDNKAGEGK